MKALVLAFIGCVLAVGCASEISRRSPYPIIREFAVPSVLPGAIRDRSEAEKVAWAYFNEFDESGGIQFSAERRDRWVFGARAGDFSAEPVSDIVVMKDGSMISQIGVAPRVRLTSGRWLYDFREVRALLWDLDEKAAPQRRLNQSHEPTPLTGR